ncbi:IgGFc-binding protein [Sorangium sp. KYC3313]|uniref:IgGFc-binding protein n=1 Tax=Sorangium sp. KYC3313 TaxID=3449740 RepID=UPI003F8AC8D0
MRSGATVRALGSEYVYARYRSRVQGQDEAPPTRITGAVDGTTLSWDPAPPPGAQATVDKGKSFVVRSSQPFVVRSQDDEHPFYVSTYMTRGAAFQNAGDPEFVNVVPAGQYLSRYIFFTDPTYPETNVVFLRKKGADRRHPSRASAVSGRCGIRGGGPRPGDPGRRARGPGGPGTVVVAKRPQGGRRGPGRPAEEIAAAGSTTAIPRLALISFPTLLYGISAMVR